MILPTIYCESIGTVVFIITINKDFKYLIWCIDFIENGKGIPFFLCSDF